MQLDNLSELIHKSVLLSLNFIDELAIFALTRFGVHWPWLHWVGTILLIMTILYWCFRLWRYCYQLQHQD